MTIWENILVYGIGASLLSLSFWGPLLILIIIYVVPVMKLVIGGKEVRAAMKEVSIFSEPKYNITIF